MIAISHGFLTKNLEWFFLGLSLPPKLDSYAYFVELVNVIIFY